MSITDPIADLLTRIRNASSAGLRYSVIPASKLKVEFVKVLEAEGFVSGFRLLRDNGQGRIKVAIRYGDSGEPVIRGIKRVSKPGCRVYVKLDGVTGVRGGLGVAVLSTSKGILTDAAARDLKVGGEVLAHVW